MSERLQNDLLNEIRQAKANPLDGFALVAAGDTNGAPLEGNANQGRSGRDFSERPVARYGRLWAISGKSGKDSCPAKN
jgi:hypothetical protein